MFFIILGFILYMLSGLYFIVSGVGLFFFSLRLTGKWSFGAIGLALVGVAVLATGFMHSPLSLTFVSM